MRCQAGVCHDDYVPDVRKYTANVNEAAVAAIVKYCGVSLQRPDSSLVSATDLKELATARDGFNVFLWPGLPVPPART